MRIVIQRAGASSVTVDGKSVGQIETGLVLLICLEKEDNEQKVKKAAQKVKDIRLFQCPETQKMNLNITQVKGQVLAISQFTLSWRGTKGNRPGFDLSMPPEEAQQLFELFCQELEQFVPVQRGVFGANMEVSITNQGPVTFCLDF